MAVHPGPPAADGSYPDDPRPACGQPLPLPRARTSFEEEMGKFCGVVRSDLTKGSLGASFEPQVEFRRSSSSFPSFSSGFFTKANKDNEEEGIEPGNYSGGNTLFY